MTLNGYSYRTLYEQACIELQNDDNKKEVIELLQSWRKEDIDTLTQFEKQESGLMSCTQDFLNNAKVYINNVYGSSVWLIDFKNEIATSWSLHSFIAQDFYEISVPTKEKYEDFLDLLRRETPLVQSFSVPPAPTPPPATFLKLPPIPPTLSSGAILQRLSIATPILAALAQADWSLRLLGDATPRDTLVAKALELTDTLLTEVQK
jgi:hypothetical protein